MTLLLCLLVQIREHCIGYSLLPIILNFCRLSA